MSEFGALVVDAIRAALPDALAIYLYGSRARGDAHASSDVDVAVLPSSPLDSVRRFELAQEIAARVGHDVDLVDLLTATAALRVQVIADGVVLYDGAPTRREAFEARALGEYARLFDERREILADIAARGRVHG